MHFQLENLSGKHYFIHSLYLSQNEWMESPICHCVLVSPCTKTNSLVFFKVVNDLVFSGSSDQSVHAHNIHVSWG